MANELLWLPKSVASVITTTELDDQADGSLTLGPSDYANGTNKYRWASFLFFGTFDGACAAGSLAELHLFYKLDGTKYGDGEAGGDLLGPPNPSGNSLHGLFQIGAIAAVYQQVLQVPILPFDFRVGLKIVNTGQDLTDSAGHFVKICPYNEEAQ
jgi:hypothetical protein